MPCEDVTADVWQIDLFGRRSGIEGQTDHAMAESGTSTAFPETNTPATSHGVKSKPRHVLGFEQPLARLEEQVFELEALQDSKGVDYTKELRQLRINYTSLLRKTYDSLSAWETVQVARHPQRPLMRDYIDTLCREFRDRKSTRLNSSHHAISRMPSSA